MKIAAKSKGPAPPPEVDVVARTATCNAEAASFTAEAASFTAEAASYMARVYAAQAEGDFSRHKGLPANR